MKKKNYFMAENNNFKYEKKLIKVADKFNGDINLKS